MEALASWSVRKISDFDPQNLSNTAWSSAKSSVRQEPGVPSDGVVAQEPLLMAMSKSAQGLRGARELASLAWALATLRFQTPLPTVVPSEPLDLANAAWAYGILELEVAPLELATRARALHGHGVSIRCRRGVAHGHPTPGDPGRPWSPGLRGVKEELGRQRGWLCGGVARRLGSQLSCSLVRPAKDSVFSWSNAILIEWQVDNFGLFGTTRLLSKLGISPPQPCFVQTARASWQRESNVRELRRLLRSRSLEWSASSKRNRSTASRMLAILNRRGRMERLQSWGWAWTEWMAASEATWSIASGHLRA